MSAKSDPILVLLAAERSAERAMDTARQTADIVMRKARDAGRDSSDCPDVLAARRADDNATRAWRRQIDKLSRCAPTTQAGAAALLRWAALHLSYFDANPEELRMVRNVAKALRSTAITVSPPATQAERTARRKARALKVWETRRRLYGPKGLSPKAREESRERRRQRGHLRLAAVDGHLIAPGVQP